MLLTLTTTTAPATDLGWLLHKNPATPFDKKLSVGRVHLFWPEVSEARATIAMLLEVDPISLVRGKKGRGDGGPLSQYVNDRPYAAGSMLSVAMNEVFRTARQGKCTARPELPERLFDLECRLPVMGCRGGETMIRRLFEPLGYTIEATRLARDETVPEWGESNLFDLVIRRTTTVAELLNHLWVLIPVMDDAKHYWVGQDEVTKLVEKAGGWLTNHPEKEQIALRFLNRRRSLARKALVQLLDEDEVEEDTKKQSREEHLERPLSLNATRMKQVTEALLESGAKSVADLGCGEGNLTRRLLQKPQFSRVVAMDVSPVSLERAERRLKVEERPTWAERLELITGSLTYRDKRLDGLDAAAAVEVIEHIDEERLPAFEGAVFGAAPRFLVITTPNVEYNVLFEGLAAGQFRHGDHRFEWDRPTFEAWCNAAAKKHNYTVSFQGIGPAHEVHGSPTQMATFRRGGAQ